MYVQGNPPSDRIALNVSRTTPRYVIRNSKNIFLKGKRMIDFLKRRINLIFSKTKEGTIGVFSTPLRKRILIGKQRQNLYNGNNF
jgi:hypothetical protein